MPTTLQSDLLTPQAATAQASTATAPNGLRYGRFGRLDASHTTPAEIARLAGSVPATLAAALANHAYLFVPLALSAARMASDDHTALPLNDDTLNDDTLIAPLATSTLMEKAICHRNAAVDGTEYVFLSSRLHNDRFALAFEFFINIAHNYVDAAGVPTAFSDLAWSQVAANVKGETSIDAWEQRADALGQSPLYSPVDSQSDSRRRTASLVPHTGGVVMNDKARKAYDEAAFADTLAIYLLSMYLDFDYADLREREYPLIAAPALADRLRAVHQLFPSNAGYKFEILYRRRA